MEQLKFGLSQPLKRREDVRFLKGEGRYVSDIVPVGALWAVFLRSDYAHGEIVALDVTEARGMPGVHLVLTADDLLARGVKLGMKGERIDTRDGGKGAGPERPVLARGRVRFVGEALAVVVAETPDQARDALEVISFDIKPLDPALQLVCEEPVIHQEAPANRAFDFLFGDEAGTDVALAGSAHRIALEVVHNRVTAAPMEPRACFAEWDGERLHFCVNGQGVWVQRNELSRMLGLQRDRIRVTNPDVGGGFGMKGMTYPEYVVVAEAARALGRPVAWVSSRTEGMLTDNAGRDLVAQVELGFDRDYRITAYKVDLVTNLGAYNSQFGQAIQTELFAKVLTGVYKVPKAALLATGVYTNSVPIDAYRGAGRPEAIMTIERAMDHAARELAVDPVELRLKNVIREFPHTTMEDEIIDGGDFAGLLGTVAERSAGYADRLAISRAKGLLRGIGIAAYIEAILGDPDEIARVVLDEDGGATLYVGTQSNGQGHESVYSRFVSEATGIPQDMVRIVEGDSDRIARGGGTGGSRSVTVQGTATRATVTAMVKGFEEFLADEWEVPEVSFADHRFGAPGTNHRLTLAEAAALARVKGRTDLLDRSEKIELDGRSFPNGVHLCEVEIDPETGGLRLDRYSVVDDFGVLVAPNLVEGQVHGGIAQGFGQAVTEWLVQDESGQVLAATFMDYGMPRAADLPFIQFAERGIPTRTNPLGMKGCGEAGTVGALGAISNAVRDALAPVGVTRVDMPFTPNRIWGWIEEARHASS
jgi:carbon-monoxide dehydrogenase large subunit